MNVTPLADDQVRTIVVDIADFDTGLAHFTQTLGLRIDRISPADNPREADLSGHGLNVRLRRSPTAPASNMSLGVEALRGMLQAPVAGVSVSSCPTDRALLIPDEDQSLVVSRVADTADFGVGRAGMGYRDLIPNRQGGRFIASHIRIDDGGDVPDYAHFHKIRFQMIYCYKGWVRVVYEDQGPPFVLKAGDCVLQPPEIRHRVLESSAGLEVIEIGCPAEHDTFADHDIALPTGTQVADRDFGGQRFVHHVAKDATWVPWRIDGFECRHIGIAEATNGTAGVRVIRSLDHSATTPSAHHTAEFVMFFVLAGNGSFEVGSETFDLAAADSIVIPAGIDHAFSIDAATELLEVTLPAAVVLSSSAPGPR